MKRPVHPHRIEIKLRDLGQLFNSMDPSPFHEKDLDDDAEEFITSWAQEYHRHEPVSLVVHLQQPPDCPDPKGMIENAVHHYYSYRAKLSRLEFKRLMKRGRQSLVIGLAFLGMCLVLVEVLASRPPGTFPGFLRESLTIAGWVAMWRPLEIYLYDWWPLHRQGLLFRKLSRMPVEVKVKARPVVVTQAAAA